MATRTPWDPVTGDVMTEARLDTLARGWLGYVEVTANQSVVGSGTETDITSLTVTLTVQADRKLRITGHGIFSRSVADGVTLARIKEGSTELGRFCQHAPSATSEFDCAEGSIVVAPSAGSHTYKLTMQRFSGTGNITLNAAAGSAAFILVEDIGSAS